MSDIFLSYAREDRKRASQLAKALESERWTVWWDREIPAGRTFDEVIEEALIKAKCVIVLWSSKSVNSRWVRTEAAEGAERNILIPVLLESVSIPLEFRRLQTADLRSWKGDRSSPEFKRLLKDLSSLSRNRSTVMATGNESQMRSNMGFQNHGKRSVQKLKKPQPKKSPNKVADITHDLIITLALLILAGVALISFYSFVISGLEVGDIVIGSSKPGPEQGLVVRFVLSCIGYIGSLIIMYRLMKRFRSQFLKKIVRGMKHESKMAKS